jgi:GDPmannose 4,6-dehydratase
MNSTENYKPTVPGKALILGITGQDGALLASILSEKGYSVAGTTRSTTLNTKNNLTDLILNSGIAIYRASPLETDSIKYVLNSFKPTEIYNLSGQSSVSMSIEQPFETYQSIAISTHNILEILRTTDPSIRYFNACSTECFGNSHKPANEDSTFNPCNPYAIAKTASFWTVKHYREHYGIFACSGLLGNHESPLRPDKFVTKKIVTTAVRIASGSNEILKLGNIDVIRDWGWAAEYVDAMWRMLQTRFADDFIIATGKSYSLREFADHVFSEVGLDFRKHIAIDSSLLRPIDIKIFKANPEKASRILGWKATMSMPEVAKALVNQEKKAIVEVSSK